MQRLLPLGFVILVSACSRETVNSVVSPSQIGASVANRKRACSSAGASERHGSSH